MQVMDPFKRRRTKIVCTIGPATSSESMLQRLVKAGMDCARLNFSHGEPSEHLKVIHSIRRISKRTGKQVAILQDLPGPKFRIGEIRNGSVVLKKGSILTLTPRPVEGDQMEIPLRSGELPRFVPAGGTIFLSDGSIRLKVLGSNRGRIRCKCEVGGRLLSGKGVNVPRLKHGLKTFTQNDKKLLAFGLENDVDLVAVSFVRRAEDINSVRNFVGAKNREVPIIAKIEKQEALENLGSIIRASDALMVARGDLGVENPIEQVPEMQKDIISNCNTAGITVITATQMLESMVNNPTPTRAEVTDVANAIFDGTDAVMLSEETAVGNFPVQCVSTLNNVSVRAEARMLSKRKHSFEDSDHGKDLIEAMCFAAARISTAIGAKAIIASLAPRNFVSKISRYKLDPPVLAISDNYLELRRCQIVWGVVPIKAEVGEMIDNDLMPMLKKLVNKRFIKEKGRFVLVRFDSNPSRSEVGIKAVELIHSETV